jgi:hypothetical protein
VDADGVFLNSSDIKDHIISMSKTQSEVMKSVENMQMKDSTQTKSPVTQAEKVTQSKQVKFNFTSDLQNTPSIFDI